VLVVRNPPSKRNCPFILVYPSIQNYTWNVYDSHKIIPHTATTNAIIPDTNPAIPTANDDRRVAPEDAPRIVPFPDDEALAEDDATDGVTNNPVGLHTDWTLDIADATHCDKTDAEADAVHRRADSELDDAAA